MIAGSLFPPSFWQYVENHSLSHFLPGFVLVIALGFLISLFLKVVCPQIYLCYKESYKQWLYLLLFFMACLWIGPLYSAMGIMLLLFLAIQEQQKRLHFRPWIERKLKQYILICMAWAYFYPSSLLWCVPVLFWFSCAQLLWNMKVSSFREDLGLMLWLCLWIIMPAALLISIARLEGGSLKLSLYMLSVAVASTLGKTWIAFFENKRPLQKIYGEFEEKWLHRLRWLSSLAAHTFGASLILTSLHLVMTLSLEESLCLSLLIGFGSSASLVMTRFYTKLTSLEDGLMRHDQTMPVLEVLSPFFLTNWFVYPYFIHFT
jgi:hypothetical protein